MNANVKRGRGFNLILALFLTTFNASAAPQDTPGAQPEWVRYAVGGEEFTALFPELPSAYFLGSVVGGHRYAAYSDGVVYSVMSVATKPFNHSLQVYINDETFRVPKGALTFRRDVTRGGFAGKHYSYKTARVVGEILFLKTDKRVYTVRVYGADESDPSVRKFLDSFTLGEKPTAADLGKGALAGDEPPAAAQSPEPVYTTEEVTSRAVVVYGPSPMSTPEAIKKKVGGTIVVKAVLRSSGRVTDIQVVTGLPHGLTQLAVEGVRKTYFLPALKDGKRVSQHREFKYVVPVQKYPDGL